MFLKIGKSTSTSMETAIILEGFKNSVAMA
jgi:hypothetical protein